MSDIEQKTFLGASIISVNSNLGWSSSPSTVQVDVIVDDQNGDNFVNPGVGTPTFFEYGALQLGGLITSIQQNNSQSGNPVYSITIEDPRSILDGVQLIINGYTGGIFNVPNLFNIFGYLESLSFGNAEVNDTGIPWYKIKNAFLFLQQSTPILLGAHSYTIDLSALPVLPDYYRISGDFITLMDFITDICDAASHDFFFNLEDTGTPTKRIKLYTVDRSTQPQLGLITTFINSQDEIVSSNNGIEFRNEASSKFLVGGNKTDVFYQHPDLLVSGTSGFTPVGQANLTSYNRHQLVVDDNVDPKDQRIWPFWGVDDNNDVVIGENSFLTNNHKFTLASKGVNVIGVGKTYKTDLLEMRAAIDSQSAWEMVLGYYDGDVDSQHHLKATQLGLITDFKNIDELVSSKTEDELDAISPTEFYTLTGKIIGDSTGAISSPKEENQSRLYQYVSDFANEYYGKKFMVRLPDVTAKIDPDTGDIVTSLEATDGGFLSDVLWSGASSQNLLPLDVRDVSLDDNRIHAYVKFNKFEELDLSNLSSEDYVVREDTKSVFVKCTLDPRLYFTKYQTLESPRAVIELPGRVLPKDLPAGREYEEKRHMGLLGLMFRDSIVKEKGLSKEDANAIVIKMFTKFGGDAVMIGMEGLAQIPDMAAVPLKSNVDFYGPWYAVGSNGKTEFERDESLVPWNYGGFALMDLTAKSRVSSALSTMQLSEGGSVELPGVPSINMGSQLINGGPYITDISINVSTGGVTTTYRMQTWTPRLGKIPKQFTERLNKIKQNDIRVARNFKADKGRDFFRNRKWYKEFSSKGIEARGGKIRPRRKSNSSSSQYVAGEIFVDGAENAVGYNTVIMPPYHASTHLGDEESYKNKSIASLDTIFVPFTTDYASTDKLPKAEEYTGIDEINGNSLNPFDEGNFTLINKEYPSEDNEEINDAEGKSRGISLRGPLWMTGWGWDKSDKPIPRETDEDTEFIEDYKKRVDLWKSGPIYLPWDDEKKMWVGGGGISYAALTVDGITARSGSTPGQGLVVIKKYNKSTGQIETVTNSDGSDYELTVYSLYSSPSDTNAYIHITKDWYGTWWFRNEDCP